jgi:hypothetical protein
MLLPTGSSVSANAQQVSAGPSAEEAAMTNPEPSSQSAKPNTNGEEADALPDAPSAQSSQSSGASEPTGQENDNTKPLGTAAAPELKPSGVMGSKPAGAAIAPARQRRVHTILISIGVVIGAGIAIGTVAALSHGSPSRP